MQDEYIVINKNELEKDMFLYRKLAQDFFRDKHPQSGHIFKTKADVLAEILTSNKSYPLKPIISDAFLDGNNPVTEASKKECEIYISNLKLYL